MLESLQAHMNDANPEAEAEASAESTMSSDQDESQSTADTESPTTSTDETLDEQLKGLELEPSSEDGSSFLDQINGLNIIRNGLPHTFDDADSIKEYLSKGLDYTLKTQEHADTVKAFQEESDAAKAQIETERQEFEAQRDGLANGINEHRVLTQMFADLSKTDPELFEVLDNQFMNQMNMYEQQNNNPVVNELNTQLSEMRQEFDSFKGQREEQENESIRKGWDTGLAQVQTEYGPKFKAIGVKPDWAKVQNAWSSDSTGKMDVKSALFAVHGEQITKGLESRKKLAETKNKSDLRMGQDGIQNKEDAQGDKPFNSSNSRDRMERMHRLAEKYA
jgi:hypothetical protein